MEEVKRGRPRIYDPNTTYYQRNKEKIVKEVREKKLTDPEYRERLKKNTMKYHTKPDVIEKMKETGRKRRERIKNLPVEEKIKYLERKIELLKQKIDDLKKQ